MTNEMDICSSQMVPLSEIVKSLLIRENDVLGTQYLRYYEFAKDIYRDLNLTAIRYTKRYEIDVDPKCRCIELPRDFLLMSSLCIRDECGELVQLLLNSNITGPIIQKELPHDCDCECNCTDALCGTLKHYEVIYKDVEAPMPGGNIGVFQTFSRKTVYPNGDYYLEYNEPVVQYSDGMHVATVLEDKTDFICKLEVASCGCVKDNPKNREILSACCGASLYNVECGRCLCNPTDCLSYGAQNLGDRIYFDSNFNHKSVILRYFPEPGSGDFMVPLLAKTAIIYGIKKELFPYDMGVGYRALAAQRQQLRFDRMYDTERKRLFRMINRFSLKQFYATIFPPGRR